ERRLALEGVKDDPLEQVAERHVAQLRQRLQDLEDPPFDPHAGLHPLDDEAGLLRPCHARLPLPRGTMGHKYTRPAPEPAAVTPVDMPARSGMLNCMVNSNGLDTTFSALADATRRAILARLALGEASVGELASPFAMSLPAVSKHLKVLEGAGLVTRRIEGR